MLKPELIDEQKRLIESGTGPDCMKFIVKYHDNAMLGMLIDRINDSGDDVLEQIDLYCNELLEYYYDNSDYEIRNVFYRDTLFFNNLVSCLNIDPNRVLDMVSTHFGQNIDNGPGAALFMDRLICTVPSLDLKLAHETLVNYASRFFQPLDYLKLNSSSLHDDFRNCCYTINALHKLDESLGLEPVLNKALIIINSIDPSAVNFDTESYLYSPLFNDCLLSLVDDLNPSSDTKWHVSNHLANSFHNQYVLSGGKPNNETNSLSFLIAFAIDRNFLGSDNHLILHDCLVKHYAAGDKSLIEALGVVAESTNGLLSSDIDLEYLGDSLLNPEKHYDADELMGAIEMDMRILSNAQPVLKILQTVEHGQSNESPYDHAELIESHNKDVKSQQANNAAPEQDNGPTYSGPGVS